MRAGSDESGRQALVSVNCNSIVPWSATDRSTGDVHAEIRECRGEREIHDCFRSRKLSASAERHGHAV